MNNVLFGLEMWRRVIRDKNHLNFKTQPRESKSLR